MIHTIELKNNHDVWLNGIKLNPSRSLKLRNHSPTGFSWGYGGSGPSQLALAILLATVGVTMTNGIELALKHYMDFKWQHVGRWEFGKDHIIKLDIEEWVEGREDVSGD